MRPDARQHVRGVVGLQDPPLRRRDRRGPGLLRRPPRARHLARRRPRRAHRRRRHRVRRRWRGARSRPTSATATSRCATRGSTGSSRWSWRSWSPRCCARRSRRCRGATVRGALPQTMTHSRDRQHRGYRPVAGGAPATGRGWRAVIDLRSDTVTTPTAGDAARRWPPPRSATTCTARTRPSRLQERVAALFGKEAALFTPTGSMANVLGGPARWSASVQEVLCEASRPHRARRAGGARRVHRADHAHLDAPARAGRPAGDRGACSPPTWGRSSCATAAVSVENTHNFARRRGAPARGPAGAARVRRRPAAARAHRRRPDLERARRHRHRRSRTTARVADALAVCLSQGPRCAGRLAGRGHAPTRSPRPASGASGWVAACGRSACSPRPGCYALDHHLERLADDHEHARLLAEACGVDPADVDTNIVVVDVPDAPAVVAAARESDVLYRRSDPARCGSSPISTCRRGSRPRRPRQFSSRCWRPRRPTTGGSCAPPAPAPAGRCRPAPAARRTAPPPGSGARRR